MIPITTKTGSSAMSPAQSGMTSVERNARKSVQNCSIWSVRLTGAF
jgi:hypothetical protein